MFDVIKTVLIKTAINTKRRMHEVTCYFSGVSMCNQLKCWVHYALDQTRPLLRLASNSWTYREWPHRNVSYSTDCIGTGCWLRSLAAFCGAADNISDWTVKFFSLNIFQLSFIPVAGNCRFLLFVCSSPVLIGCLEFNFPRSFPSDHILITSTGITIFQSSVSILWPCRLSVSCYGLILTMYLQYK